MKKILVSLTILLLLMSGCSKAPDKKREKEATFQSEQKIEKKTNSAEVTVETGN
ncbi:hypothetical protein [Vagococcus acidifermentans]|uniref:hypothetical protein n=1 Tax=Vagococcus acidifermentans TaxID=564710 RepID=UPI00147753D1|nr:hypothetical protein [Vagococcus acidifermentans]